MSDPLYRHPTLDPYSGDDNDVPRTPYERSAPSIGSWLLGALAVILVLGGLLYYNQDGTNVATSATDPATIARTSPAADTNTGAAPQREIRADPAPAPAERQ